MEMNQVRYFLALCEEQSFTRAAKRCGVSQPSLTNAIQRLEQNLGGPLFHRHRTSTKLTDLGILLRPDLVQSGRSAAEAMTGIGLFRRQVKTTRSGFDSLRSVRSLMGGSKFPGRDTGRHQHLADECADFRLVIKDECQLAAAVCVGHGNKRPLLQAHICACLINKKLTVLPPKRRTNP